MMQALELLWLAEKHVLGWSDIEQWKNQAWAISEVCLSEGISQSDS